MIGCNIGNQFLQSVWADRTADGNGRRFITVSVLTRALKSGVPICLRIPSERVSCSGRATGHTVARCSKRVFGDRALGSCHAGHARAWTLPRSGSCHAGHAGAWTLPRSGSCRAGHAGAWTLPRSGSCPPVTRERDPTGLGIMPRRSRGSVTLPASG